MRKESLFPVRPDPAPLLALTILLLLLQSCLQPTSVDCGPDFACPAGMKCAANQNICIEDNCGDSTLQQGEACDDGNIEDGDGCSANCLSTEVCGNGIIDQAINEKCDDGEMNGKANHCDRECKAPAGCGNNLLEPGEDCDNGKVDTTTCDKDCTVPFCGDGHVNEAASEACDPKSDTSCNINCTRSVCGDGIVNPNDKEQCDSGQADISGKTIDTKICNADCTVARCGDGYVNSAADEDCEPSRSSSCSPTCKASRCGDGIVDKSTGEACDDGNNDNCGTCGEDCKQKKEYTAAIGSIVAVSSDLINDGDWFSISDGNKRLEFEFNKTDGVQADRIPITIDDTLGPRRTALKIKEALEDQKEFNIQFSSVWWNVVWLEHKAKGESGNQLLDKGYRIPNTSTNIEVYGMSDGAGVYCPSDTGCKSNQDCASGKCESGKCK